MTRDEATAIERIDIAVAVVERDDQVLIGLRPEGAPLAGYWEFPGGKVADGETPEDAARRECWEETGVAVRITGDYGEATHEYPHGAIRLHFFAAEPIGEQRLPHRFRWVRRVELERYKFPPANARLLALLQGRDPK
jgi:8-oxo-dGTP diphosphatase